MGAAVEEKFEHNDAGLVCKSVNAYRNHLMNLISTNHSTVL